jgi:hypothetical protein
MGRTEGRERLKDVVHREGVEFDEGLDLAHRGRGVELDSLPTVTRQQ